MIIDCTDKEINPLTQAKQKNYLKNYEEYLGRKTDVTVPVYSISEKDFKEIWPPRKIPDKVCDKWVKILSDLPDYDRENDFIYSNPNNENKYIDLDPCSHNGDLTVNTSIVFVNENKLNHSKYDEFDIVNSPGIYIKDPVNIRSPIFNFALSFNLHLANSYYLYNRNNAKTLPISDSDYKYFEMAEHFLISFLTLKSIYEVNEDLVNDIISNSTKLIGSWKMPFSLLNKYSIDLDDLSEIFESDALYELTYELFSGKLLTPEYATERIADVMKNFVI